MSNQMDPVTASRYLVQAYADLMKYYTPNQELRTAIVMAIAALNNTDKPTSISYDDLI